MQKLREGKSQKTTSLWHANCMRCGGSVYDADDHYGRYQQCFQCSYVRYLDAAPTIKPIAPGHLKPGKKAGPKCRGCGTKLKSPQRVWCSDYACKKAKAKVRDQTPNLNPNWVGVGNNAGG